MEETTREPHAVNPSAAEESDERAGQPAPVLVARMLANPRRVRRA